MALYLRLEWLFYSEILKHSVHWESTGACRMKGLVKLHTFSCLFIFISPDVCLTDEVLWRLQKVLMVFTNYKHLRSQRDIFLLNKDRVCTPPVGVTLPDSSESCLLWVDEKRLLEFEHRYLCSNVGTWKKHFLKKSEVRCKILGPGFPLTEQVINLIRLS